MSWQPVPTDTYATNISAPLPPLEAVLAGPGYSQPPPPKNPLATAALTFGVIGLLLPVLAIVAIILGHIAAANKTGVGRHLARGGYGLGYVTIFSWGLFIISLAVIGTM